MESLHVESAGFLVRIVRFPILAYVTGLQRMILDNFIGSFERFPCLPKMASTESRVIDWSDSRAGDGMIPYNGHFQSLWKDPHGWLF